MAGFHPWAEALHRDSLKPVPTRKPRFRCSACPHRLTKNQARINNGDCNHCGAPLAAKMLFASATDAEGR